MAACKSGTLAEQKRHFRVTEAALSHCKSGTFTRDTYKLYFAVNISNSKLTQTL